MGVSALSTTILLIVAGIAYSVLGSILERHSSKDPIVENSWFNYLTGRSVKTATLVQDAYYKYSKKSRLFRIYSMCGLQYMLPSSVFDEVRRLPPSVLSPNDANEEMLNLRPFLTMDYHDVVPFINRDISRCLPAILPDFIEEIGFAFKEKFPAKDSIATTEDGVTYYPTAIHGSTLASIGIVISTLFMGKAYGRDQHWTKTVANFAFSVTVQGLFLRRLPKVIIPMVAKILPIQLRLYSLRKMMRADILRLIKHNREAKKTVNGSSQLAPGDSLILDAQVKYVLSQAQYRAASEEQVATGVSNRMLSLLFATIDTSSITFTQVIHDIIGHPRVDWSDPMIAEIKTVLAKNGGQWDLKALGELKLLDSFIKESQRLHPLGYTLSGRKVVSVGGYTFKAVSGDPTSKPLHVPQGARVELPVYGVHRDPSIYSDPDTFNGFRFAKDAVSSSQPSEKFISFGYGVHACPGRHFALVLIKLMTIEFLLKYEWKEIKRLDDWAFGVNSIPDMSTKVCIRRKAGM